MVDNGGPIVRGYLPPPLYKLWPCQSYSGRRDCINLGPHLIRDDMHCSHNRYWFANKLATYVWS